MICCYDASGLKIEDREATREIDSHQRPDSKICRRILGGSFREGRGLEGRFALAPRGSRLRL
jgi:hypothetical protein